MNEETHINKIIVVSYAPEWPRMFEAEAEKIKEALGDNCIALHHVGSTSVPGLSAKPIIDIIGVMKDLEKSIEPLESLGFIYRGEYNIPMRFFFNRRQGIEVNLHAYEEGHPEIELNMAFRDYLQSHSEAREEYAKLKENLLNDNSSSIKKNVMFTGYSLGKDAFIRNILKMTHFNRIRMTRCAHYAEWEMANRLRDKYFFAPQAIADPYTWTFEHSDHAHLIFYTGVEMVGYAHIQFCADQKAIFRMIVNDEPYRRQGLGSQFLQLLEGWLKKQGVQTLYTQARLGVVEFYRKNGYVEMLFEDPEGEPHSPLDIAMGKKL
jgi:GrpB-like predicted nucleotidyltransferase (UPF0157 family)/GNAT superfamily N-acetyltransferase